MTRQEEVDRNYVSFANQLPDLLETHRGAYALMKGGRILGFHASAEDARLSAEALIDDGLYSIQLISDESVDLGFFTDAVPLS